MNDTLLELCNKLKDSEIETSSNEISIIDLILEINNLCGIDSDHYDIVMCKYIDSQERLISQKEIIKMFSYIIDTIKSAKHGL